MTEHLAQATYVLTNSYGYPWGGFISVSAATVVHEKLTHKVNNYSSVSTGPK